MHQDWSLMILAGAMCVIMAATSCFMLRYAMTVDGASRRHRLMAAAIIAGGGIWATHFVAMLDHDVPGGLHFLLAPTLGSLAGGLLILILGLRLLDRPARTGRAAIAGAIAGAGSVAMHYIGVHAVLFDGTAGWNAPLVLLSIAACLGISAVAFPLMIGRERSLPRIVTGAGLFALSVALLHFTGMAAMTFVPGAGVAQAGMLFQPSMMGPLIGGATLLLLFWIGSLTFSLWSRDHALRQNERDFTRLIDSVHDVAICSIDPDGRIRTWNTGARQITGYDAEEAIGMPVERLYPPEARAENVPMEALRTAREEGIARDILPRVRRDGSVFQVSSSIEPIYAEDGSLQAYSMVLRDITRLRQAERQRDDALDNMHQGVTVFDRDRRLVVFNSRMEEMHNLAPGMLKIGMGVDEVVRVLLTDFTPPDELDEVVRDALRNHLALVEQPDGARVITEPNRSGTVFSMAVNPLEDGGWVATLDDITERHNAGERLQYMATHDSLTGLANRAHFRTLLNDRLDKAEAEGGNVLLAMIDLDRFKQVNDSFGHMAGDDLLRDVSRRLEQLVEKNGFAARLGGDEFAVVMPLDTADEAETLGERIAGQLDFTFVVEGKAIQHSASVGISVSPADATEAEALSGNADLAMYRAKRDQSISWCRYEWSMDEEARERRQLQAELRLALEKQQFELFYQVQCVVATGVICGHEALIRWRHPERGLVMPDKFIESAEDTGLIVPIGEWVLREACMQAAQWPLPHKVAVNISPIQLVRRDLPTKVVEALIDSGLPAERLEIEITESAIVSDKLRALHNLRQLKALGVSIAIDDFGTGYSSLDTLSSFSFDKIKIDRSFLMDSQTNAKSQKIVRAVLALGESLDLPVLAEGVETIEDLELLRRFDCTEGQGFYFGRPQPYPMGMDTDPDTARIAAAGA